MGTAVPGPALPRQQHCDCYTPSTGGADAAIQPITPQATVISPSAKPQADTGPGRWHDWFTHFAYEAARYTGKPAAFLVAFAIVVIWAMSGPAFGFSDTWQLVINTGTTIVTFLMVFLIQNTQNRDTLALQIKLAELIFVMQGAKNNLATIEDLSNDELEKLHDEYRSRADETLESLTKRRAKSANA